jgi:hypothetical protein
MKNFALAVTMLVVVAASSSAQAAPKQDFCTSSKATLFICTATAVTIGLAIVSLAEGKPRKPSPSGKPDKDPNMWKNTPVRPDTSTGCAWGDRKYGTCH